MAEDAAAVWNDIVFDDDDMGMGEREPDLADGGLAPPEDGTFNCCCGSSAGMVCSDALVVSDFRGEAEARLPRWVLFGAGGAGSGRDWITRERSSS